MVIYATIIFKAVYGKSARHKAQRMVLTENAFAIIIEKGDGAAKGRDYVWGFDFRLLR